MRFKPAPGYSMWGAGQGPTVEHLIGQHGFLAAGSIPRFQCSRMDVQETLFYLSFEQRERVCPSADCEWDGIYRGMQPVSHQGPGAALRECRRVLRPRREADSKRYLYTKCVRHSGASGAVRGAPASAARCHMMNSWADSRTPGLPCIHGRIILRR